MHILKRSKIPKTILAVGDSIILSYRDPHGKETEVLREYATRPAVLDEAVAFEVEPGDFEGAHGGIGGAFLDTRTE